jgi:uncharacterized protein YbjT (DUF2867 family)
MPKRVLFAGATGLVGSRLLRLLQCDDRVERVTLAVRRETGLQGGKVQSVVVDFRLLASPDAVFPTCDAAVCCLGTTLKAAGSREAFLAVDRDAVVSFAKQAKAAGARTFVVVSALGADAGSSLFYSRVKGETEDALRTIGFSSLHLVRPSLLVGHRQEFRLAGRLGIAVAPLLKILLAGPLAKWAPVDAEDVAVQLQSALFDERPGVHIHFNAPKFSS